MGKAKLYDYCRDRSIPHRAIGKLIIAVEENEIDVLKGYQQRAIDNGVTDLRYVSREQLSELEPQLEAITGLLSPSTGIVDSHELMFNFLADITNNAGMIVYGNTEIAPRAISSTAIPSATIHLCFPRGFCSAQA